MGVVGASVRKGDPMKRLVMATVSVAVLLAFFAPAALAASVMPASRAVLVSVNGSVNVPAGDRLNTLIVVDGNARVSGQVQTIVIATGTATLAGATADNLVVLDGSADLQAGTTVRGDIRTLHGTVTQQAGATVGGSVRNLDTDLAALGVLLVGAFIVLFIGLGLTGIAIALLVAALAGRQVRSTEALISRQPGQVLVAGILGTIALPALAVILMLTVVGAPIGLAMLLILAPVTAFAWLVAAIWVGDWIVTRVWGSPEPERPYRAAVIGVIVLAAAGMLPLVSAIATLFGFGALLLGAWRTLRHEALPLGASGSSQPAPSVG